MSVARLRMSALLVRWPMIVAMSTAWAWWSVMSRAKPAAAELSPGEWVPAVVRPTIPAISRASTAASASAPIWRAREPIRSGPRGGVSPTDAGGATNASAIGRAGAAGAGRAQLRRLRTLLVLLHEGLEPRVAGVLQAELLA